MRPRKGGWRKVSVLWLGHQINKDGDPSRKINAHHKKDELDHVDALHASFEKYVAFNFAQRNFYRSYETLSCGARSVFAFHLPENPLIWRRMGHPVSTAWFRTAAAPGKALAKRSPKIKERFVVCVSVRLFRKLSPLLWSHAHRPFS